MASVSDLAKTAQKFTIDNSPLILTVVGALGVISTGLLAARGGFKAAEILEHERQKHAIHRGAGGPPVAFSAKEKVAMTWQCFIPSCGVGLLTVGAVVGSNRIGTNRAAALATAFALSEKHVAEYKNKVVEKFGQAKENQVVDSVAKDRVLANPPTDSNVLIVGNGKQMFQDSWSGRYFQSEAETVRAAVNELNHQLNIHGHATLTDFYELLGLPKNAGSDEIGWNADNLLDVYFAAVMHEDGKQPVIAIEYRVVPSRDYFRSR